MRSWISYIFIFLVLQAVCDPPLARACFLTGLVVHAFLHEGCRLATPFNTSSYQGQQGETNAASLLMTFGLFYYTRYAMITLVSSDCKSVFSGSFSNKAPQISGCNRYRSRCFSLYAWLCSRGCARLRKAVKVSSLRGVLQRWARPTLVFLPPPYVVTILRKFHVGQVYPMYVHVCIQRDV